jgi:hypothetical protein
MQNKAKFKKVKLNVNKVLTKNYEQIDTWSSGTKQSQTNPNKAKFKKAKMNVTSILTKGYENKPPIRAPKKQRQTSKRQKPMQTSLPQRIMKETRFRAPKKQTQFKPNLSRRSLWRRRKQTQPVVSLSNLFQSQYLKIAGRRGPFAYESDPNEIDKTNCILSTNCVMISKYTRSNKMQLTEDCCPNFNEGANLCMET